MTLEKRILQFIKDYMNCGFDIQDTHFLTKDLGIDGDEAIYFLEDFSIEFNVDFSNLDVTKKFACERTDQFIWKLIQAIFMGKKELLVYEDIKVDELIEAVRIGKWPVVI